MYFIRMNCQLPINWTIFTTPVTTPLFQIWYNITEYKLDERAIKSGRKARRRKITNYRYEYKNKQ